jgi:hypothetical protein
VKGEERQEYLNSLGALAIPPPVATVYARDVESSPCSVCGGDVRGNDCDWFGVWRRHRECSPLVGSEPDRLVAASRWLGVADLSRVDASLIEFGVPCYSVIHKSPVWSNERTKDRLLPWRFVDKKQLARAVKALPALRRRAGLDPSRCASGACAWCGVVESCGWFTSRQVWRLDGSRAPLCRSCHEVDVRHGRPTHPDDLPAALAEAITGVPIMMGEQPPPGLVPFCEHGDRQGQEPWAHLPPEAVEAFRWHAWGRYNARYAPPEHRQEALDRWAAAEAAKASRNGEKAAQEVAKADVYGFNSIEEVTP